MQKSSEIAKSRYPLNLPSSIFDLHFDMFELILKNNNTAPNDEPES